MKLLRSFLLSALVGLPLPALAAECVTIPAAGWTQERINHRAAIALQIYGTATGQAIAPQITGDQICFPGASGDVAAIVTAQAMLDSWNAQVAAWQAATAAQALIDAEVLAEQGTCAFLLSPATPLGQIDAYYLGRFDNSLTTVADVRNRTRLEFIRLARCVRSGR